MQTKLLLSSCSSSAAKRIVLPSSLSATATAVVKGTRASTFFFQKQVLSTTSNSTSNDLSSFLTSNYSSCSNHLQSLNNYKNKTVLSVRFKSTLHKKSTQTLSKNNKNNVSKTKNNKGRTTSESGSSGIHHQTKTPAAFAATTAAALNGTLSNNSANVVASKIESSKEEVEHGSQSHNQMKLGQDDNIMKDDKEQNDSNAQESSKKHYVTNKKDGENEVVDNVNNTVNQQQQEQVVVPPQPLMSPVHQGHLHEFAPRIVVVGVGGGGGNAINNMISNQLNGVDFLALNTDAQHLSTILSDNRLQIGSTLTSGLGCGANPDAGRLAAEESRAQITELLSDAHMVFITAGMGGGTGTGAAPVVAEVCYNLGILTVGVVTKPFRFEGTHRMRLAKEGISRLEKVVDTLIVIPNQNLFLMANDQTSFMDAFNMADNVLLGGVKSITDLMTTPGLINLDFADVQSVMHGMGNAMLGTGIGSNDSTTQERAIMAAEQALANPLLGENMDIGTAKGMLVNITGGRDMTLFEVDRAAQCITERIQDENANIIFGSAYDETLDGCIRVSVVATGIEEKAKEV